MNKRGKLSKIVVMVVVGLVIALAVFSVVSSAENASENNSGDSELTAEEKDKLNKKVDAVASADIAEEVKNYVEEFAQKRDVQAEQINDISQVDFDSLPKEVNIENVNEANLAIYQVNYNETDESNNTIEEKDLFVITYSTEKLKAQGDIIIASDKREFLHFGSVGELSAGFLNTATGVEGSLESGYVMMREGSVTGISTSLDVLQEQEGASIEIIIYKNGEAISFSNEIYTSSKGVGKDHDIQSNGIVTFKPGDVISAYAKASDGSSVKFKSVITMVEITTK